MTERIRGMKDWNARSTRVKDEYYASLDVLSRARNENLTIKTAAKKEGFPFKTAMRYIEPATERDAFNRVVAREADRLFRPMQIPDEKGRLHDRAVYGSRKAAMLSRLDRALGRAAEGDYGALIPFENQRVAGITLPSDPNVAVQMARDGTLDELDPYDRSRAA